MSPETKQCQNCKNSFDIASEDFAFYEKMKVPPPTWCPECRMMRRFSFFNLLNLYRRACNKCGKNIISIFSPDKNLTVYCMPCWWADDWDGTEYGMDYDPSRPFLDQVYELSRKTPWQALEDAYTTNINSDYVNGTAWVKNCYLTYWADFCENVLYSVFLGHLKDSLDCYRMSNSELCYEDIGCNKCFRTFFSEECEACADVWFSRNCSGCTNCFGCVNLRNKSYYIFNKPYSKDEYFEKLKEFNLHSRSALTEIKKQVYEFWNLHPRRAYTGNSLNVNVSGDYIYESKNTHDAYMATGVEDSRFVQFLSVNSTKDSYDYSGWGNGAEKMYECMVVGEGSNQVKFTAEGWPNTFDVEYSFYVISSKHLFGCSNIKKKEYCILNKQYSKVEYEKLVEIIKEDMRNRPYRDGFGRGWHYGEFLPINFSPFAYNETLAHLFFPKSENEAAQWGTGWHDFVDNKYQITKKSDSLPDTIGAVDDSVLKEVIGCGQCGKGFRIVPAEFDFMRRHNLPLPVVCPNCRIMARFNRTNPPRLYDRKCTKCGKDMKTSYAPDRPEIIYCESCYQSEVQ